MNESSDLSSSKRSRYRPWEVLRFCEVPRERVRYSKLMCNKRILRSS